MVCPVRQTEAGLEDGAFEGRNGWTHGEMHVGVRLRCPRRRLKMQRGVEGLKQGNEGGGVNARGWRDG